MAKKWSERLQEANTKNLVQAELDILKFWKENNTLQKSIDNRAGKKSYSFYDGPITTNNQPHHGHALTMVLKDLVPRYWTMRGYNVVRSLGWDCQGIPVEYQVEKELGFQNKKDIEAYGVEKFNQLCRDSVIKYQSDMRKLTERMGRWVSGEEEYATMDPNYIESIWWSLKELYTKGLLYEGLKVVPYSTRAGTTLSNSEVALGGYKDIVDPAVTVKFKKVGEEKYFLAWTTTPWTLPGNLLLAVVKDGDYIEAEQNGLTYILAKSLAEKILGKEYTIKADMKGTDLAGMKYEPLFAYFIDRKEQGAFKVVTAEHVTMDDGTGIVHQAPYGEDDFELIDKLGIKQFDYLDETGSFTKIVPEFEGQFYKKANDGIMANLTERGLLFASEQHTHRMPMCWRTDTPLIYKPVSSWYVKVTAIRDQLVKENKEIKWIPKHIREGRFGNWLENARDWALSRKRYWGTPLPVWKCAECNTVDVLGSYAEVQEKSGKTITDPHKPFVDEVTYTCTCGGTMSRVSDVIDVWYDSGAMPFARFHYPFENKEKFEKKFPAQYIAEGIDQTRGWFYTLHVLGVALFGSKAFEHVVVNGMALAKDGTKMSKRLKNYTDVDIVLKDFGADPMRLYFLNSPIVKGEDVLFDEKFLKDVNTATILPLWNSVKYFLNYAATSNIVLKADTMPAATNLMDQWVVVKFKEMVNSVNTYMEAYNMQKATSAFIAFIEDLSRWYIRGSRDRFVAGDTKSLETLHYVLVNLAKVMAPFAPFLAETVYQLLAIEGMPESVHLTDYPVYAKLSATEQKVIDQMTMVKELSNLGQNLRITNGLKLRQPLEKLFVSGSELESEYMNLVLGELNVKSAVAEEVGVGWVTGTLKEVTLGLYTKLSDELVAEGLYREIARIIQNARKEAKLQVGQKIALKLYTESVQLKQVIDSQKEQLLSDINAATLDWNQSQLEKTEKIGDAILGFELV